MKRRRIHHKNTLPEDKPVENPDRKTHPLSIIAFVGGLVGIAGMIIGSGVAILLYLSLLLILSSLVLGIIALVKTKKNPDKYKNKWMAITIIVLFSLFIVLLVVMTLYVYYVILGNGK